MHLDGTPRLVGMNILGVLVTDHTPVLSAALLSSQYTGWHAVRGATGVILHTPVRSSLRAPGSPEELSKVRVRLALPRAW